MSNDSDMAASPKGSQQLLQYRADPPLVSQRVPAVAQPLAVSGAVCTAVGFALAFAPHMPFALPRLGSLEQEAILGVSLVVYVGQPLAFASMLIVRRPWSRETPTCRLSHPVPLTGLMTLLVPSLLALPLALATGVPQLGGACGCAPVLMGLGLLTWFGGLPSRHDFRRHLD